MTPVDLASIRAAHDRIRPHIHRTPVVTCGLLNERAGCPLYFKCENLQKAGAFKSRGAVNAVFSLDDKTAARGVVTHSSGNHASALARAAGLRGIPAHIVMPETSPRVKVAAVENYGGQITFCAPTLTARETTAQRLLEETGGTLIHPYDDWRIIAGQATAALEFLEDCPQIDTLMTPVGGGGLLAGTLLAASALRPDLQVLGGEPEQVDDAFRSVAARQRLPLESGTSIADGLLTSLGKLTFPIIEQSVEAILLASEASIVATLHLMMERMKLVIEPSAAVPLAALLASDLDVSGRKVGIILSGGNLDLSQIPAPL
ncbi:MAG: pyridoxal-phosphate dependent enzyme [Planctomycetaceae bacterium]